MPATATCESLARPGWGRAEPGAVPGPEHFRFPVHERITLGQDAIGEAAPLGALGWSFPLLLPAPISMRGMTLEVVQPAVLWNELGRFQLVPGEPLRCELLAAAKPPAGPL